METFYSTSSGKILHGDNIECLRSFENTESEPYCSVGKKRVEGICSNRAKKLF